MARSFGTLHPTADLHGIAAMRGNLYSDGRGPELEPGYVMGWTVNNFTLRVSIENIQEGISRICNSNGDVVGVSNGKNHMGCR